MNNLKISLLNGKIYSNKNKATKIQKQKINQLKKQSFKVNIIWINKKKRENYHKK